MPLPDLVDSHCHLDFPDFGGDVAGLLARAHAAGVRRMVTICTRLREEPKVRALAQAHAGLFYAAGTHPMSAGEEPFAPPEVLLALTAHPKYVGIGETGLDYHYSAESREAQIKAFHAHITAAQESGLPLIVHARAADDEIGDILTARFAERSFGCVMHCYSSGPRLAQRALEMGFYLSMSGIAAFPKSHDLRAIFAAAPLDQILVETDSPYLAPPPYRGQRNEPAYVAETAKVGAGLFGLSLAEFAAATTANFDRLFVKAAR